jgi:hypothetical protein
MLALQILQTTRPGIVPNISQQCSKTCRIAAATSHPRRAIKSSKFVQRHHIRIVMASSEQEGKLFNTNFVFQQDDD